MQTSSQTQSQPRPFYWNVPVVEKDYMSENVRRMRAVSSQQKKSKREPMKATFVPGVTKNSKYDHVPSRLAGIIHPSNNITTNEDDISLKKTHSHTGIPASKSNQTVRFLPDKFNPLLNGNLKRIESFTESSRSSKPIWGASEAANSRRICRSTTDLTSKEKSDEKHGVDFHIPSRRKKQEPLKPNEESVYNWHFSDVNNVQPMHHTGIGTEIYSTSKDQPNPHYHRVEYLPCDGICAEENFTVVNGCENGDSGRSSTSSCRTSRGVNTDETRIFQDGYEPLHRVKSLDRMEDQLDRHIKEVPTKQKTMFTLKNQTDTENRHVKPAPNPQNYTSIGKSDAQMNRIRNEMSSLKVKDSQTETSIPTTMGPSGDMPHNLGAVPKYLKQRQQEWKVEALAKKEAERNKDIPAGHILMSDQERVETLNTLRKNYDSLVEELNRIPIRMDTIRVRDQKIKLENQFAKLEQAMRVFSRPRVFVKLDQ